MHLSLPPRRFLVCLLIFFGLGLAVLSSPILWRWWQDFRYVRQHRSFLDGDVDYVEFQPNTDWPRRRISDPETIAALKLWIATREESKLRSAPPMCICEMRFVFRDGREKVIQHSPFRERLDGQRCSDF